VKPFVSRPRYNGPGKRSYELQQGGVVKPFVARPRYSGSGKRSYAEAYDGNAANERRFEAMNEGAFQDQRQKGKMPYRMRHRFFSGKKKKDAEDNKMERMRIEDAKEVKESKDATRGINSIRGILFLRDSSDIDDALSAELKKRGYTIEKVSYNSNNNVDDHAAKRMIDSSGLSFDQAKDNLANANMAENESRGYYNIRK